MDTLKIYLIYSVVVFFVGWVLAKKLPYKYHLLSGFATGMLAMLCVCKILPDAWEVLGPGMFGILVGLVSGWLLFSQYNDLNVHNIRKPTKPHRFFRILLIVAHSVLDGLGLMVIVSADMSLDRLWLAVFFAHRLSYGFTTSVVMKKLAMSPKIVFQAVLAIAAAPFLSWLIFHGLERIISPEHFISSVSGLVFGFFSMMIWFELAPELSQKEHHCLPTLISVVVGIVVTLILTFLG